MKRRRGFALIEVLAALAVVAASVAAILMILGPAYRTFAAIDRAHARQERSARAWLAAESPAVTGAGNFKDGDWRIEARPLDTPAARALTREGWTALTVTVRGPDGTVAAQTVRARKGAP
jgi:general secretion pathway protein I